MGRKRRRNRGGTRGSWSRRAVVAGLGSIAVGGVFATGAFDQVSVERTSSVSTADDSDALLRFTEGTPDGKSGNSVELFSLTNRFGETLDSISVTQVSTGDNDLDVVNIELPTSLNTGIRETVTGELSCNSDVSDVDVEFEIIVSGNGQSVKMTRTIHVTCDVESTNPGDDENYKDGKSGSADQPDDPAGTINSPGNVAERDGDSASAGSPGSEKTKVGYRLPVQSASGKYEFLLVIGGQTSQGHLNQYEVYLVDEEGTRAEPSSSELDNLSTGENIAQYPESEIKDKQLYVVFEQTGSTGGQEIYIDFFELQPI